MSRSTLFAATLVVCAGAGHLTAAVVSEGWAVLPVEEYRALRKKALPPERPPEAPPVDATLTRVDYDLRVADHERRQRLLRLPRAAAG